MVLENFRKMMLLIVMRKMRKNDIIFLWEERL